MQLFKTMHPQGARGLPKAPQKGSVSRFAKLNLGMVLYKIELEGDPEIFTVGFMKMFDTTQPRKKPQKGSVS